MTAFARYRGWTHWSTAIGWGLSVTTSAAGTVVTWPVTVGDLRTRTRLIVAAVLYAGLLVLVSVGIRSD